MQQVDQNLNPWQGSLDQIGGGLVTDARTASAVLGALNAELVMDLNGKAVAAFDIRASANSATYVFEVSVDGTNYVQVPARAVGGVIAAAAQSEFFVNGVVVATTAGALYVVNVTGMRRVRCRVSAYTSGNATVSGRATSADYAIVAQPQPSLLHVTATAAANTAATATLPAAVGLFHYITAISLMRNATAALAGTATLIHTTTNLPGSPAWSVGNAMVAGGTQTDLSMTFSNPLKSSVANTNTTIVMPAAGLAVLNRINVSYYLGA